MISPLSKELTLILIIKLIVLYAIWYVFFSSPAPVNDLSSVLLPQ